MHKKDWVSNRYSERLRLSRLNKGLNQTELGREFATNQSTISRIESGKIPRKRLANRVISFVFDYENQLNVDQVAEIVSKSDELKAFVRRIAKELP